MRWFVVVLLLSAPARADSVEGARLLEAGRLDEAKAHFEGMLAAGKGSGWTHFDLCLVHYTKGEYGKAIESCYRALDDITTEKLAHEMLVVIRDELRAQGLAASGLLPHPSRRWSALDLEKQVAGSHEKATRVAPAVGPVRTATLDAELRGQAPPLPYRVPIAKSDYTRGYDVVLVTGALFYAKDASPFVAGLRGEVRVRKPGGNGFGRTWGEYLHAPDNTGGIAAFGAGAAGGGKYGERGFGIDAMFSVPFGKDDRRQDVVVPGYQTALMLAVRGSLHYELDLGPITIGVHPAIDGGLNLGRLFRKGFPRCQDDTNDECKPESDKNTTWKWTYWMLQLGVSIGARGGYPRYHREDIFAPSGAR